MSDLGVPGATETHPLPQELLDEGACMEIRRNPSWPKRDIFFPPDELNRKPNAKAMQMRDEAWAIYCRTCPVLQRCFDHAYEHEEYGVWAGTTQLDRYRMGEDRELLEYARNRLAAGYVPIPSILCYFKGCTTAVAREGTLCRVHKGHIKRVERKGKKR